MKFRRRKVLIFALLVAALVLTGEWLYVYRQPQLVGQLHAKDVEQITRIVKQDLRDKLLPEAEFDTIFYPRYVFNCFKEYSVTRLLWIEVDQPGYVNVFAGFSKDEIKNTGHVYSLSYNDGWQIVGYAYWGSPPVAPGNLVVPR